MKEKIRIDSVIAKREASMFIWSLPFDPVHQVEVDLAEITRTVAQNRLYWKWITIIGEELGWTKDYAHFHYRKEFLVHIYERDDNGYAEMIQAVREVYSLGMRVKAEKMHRQIVRLTSTTTASTKQFAEYLFDIEKDSIGRNIRLPHPDEYNKAMGIRERKKTA